MTGSIFRVTLFVCVAFLYFSCASSNTKINYKNPKKVALMFANALMNHDIEQAKRLSTTSTKEVLNMLQTLSDGRSGSNQANQNQQVESSNLKKASCLIDDNKASCTLCCFEESTEEVRLILLKEDEKWLVNMSKEALRNTQ